MWLLGGQSNAFGRGDYTGLPSNLQPENATVDYALSVMLSGTNSPTQERSWGAVGPFAGLHGAEITFGADMVAAGKAPAILKWARGGTDLPTFLSTYYARMVAYWQAQLALAPWPYHLRGLIWIQGETDADTAPNAAAWGTNFETLRTQLETDLGTTNLAYMIYEINVNTGAVNVPAVRSSQVAEVATLQAAGRTAAIVNADDQALQVDGLHLQSAGQQVVGDRIKAQAMTWFP